VEHKIENSLIQQGIALFDSAHKLIRFNQTLAHLWGLSAIRLQKQPMYEVLLAEVSAQGHLSPAQRTQLEQALSQSEIEELAFTVVQPNNTCIAIHTIVMPDGGRLLTLQDVTNQQQTESRLTSEVTRLTFLLDLTKHLQASEDLREIGQFVLTYLVKAMKADWGDIKVIHSEGSSRHAKTLITEVTAEFIATYGEPAVAEMQRTLLQGIPYGQGLIWQVVETGIPRFVENYATHPNIVPAFRHPAISHLGIFPIPSASGQIIGLLTLESRNLKKLQQMSHQDMLLATCQMLGAAIERNQAKGALVRAEVAEAAKQELEKEVIERKQAEAQLLHNALHDQLTGLPNRTLFMERLEHALQLAKRRDNYLFAVLFLDLDRFKLVNDSLGHMAGDQLLIELSLKLKSHMRIEDTVARLGGDEFTILLENLNNISEVTYIANRIQQDLALPFNLNGHEVFTTVSIGIALSTNSYDQPESLLRDADIAMYRAKTLGKARYEIFSIGMHTRAVALLQLETDLRRAIERQDFQLHYQPIVLLEPFRIKGFEALIRWQHPERGLVYPEDFIPVAEETGLIIPIGQWVLRESCRQMVAWQAQFPKNPSLTISVNISARQFRQPDLVEQIKQILKETGLDACRLKLEITESVLMDNAESATSMLLKLKALGVQLHMDDFGTGYSSLSYLHRFPVSMLKIDRSFVSNMGVSGENSEVIRTIVTLAKNLGMDVTAEGIETAEQLVQLKEINCRYGQGYLFAKPVNANLVGNAMSMYQLLQNTDDKTSSHQIAKST